MARLARVEVFAADEIAIVHVMNRTVRRCFLLGDDPVSGKNYDHRKQWLDDQLIHQARHFGIDLLCQAILSNHFHLVLRSRPDVVAEWSDTEVARRWLMLCPERRDANGRPTEPSESEINHICKDKSRLKVIRSRLSDISWWMRLLSQNIAQRANRDDKEVGKFWQARYRAVRLLDETAILGCAAYVDLNPIRAALAETIEESEFTSAQKRVAELRRKLAAGSGVASAESCRDADQTEEEVDPQKAPSSDLSAGIGDSSCRSSANNFPDAGEKGRNACRHLAPVQLKSASSTIGPCVNKRGERCSNKGFLPMSTADYLSLLDWTARQTRKNKRGATPKKFAPLFDRLGISAEIWCRLVKDFGKPASANRRAPSQRQLPPLPDASGNSRTAGNGLSLRRHLNRLPNNDCPTNFQGEFYHMSQSVIQSQSTKQGQPSRNLRPPKNSRHCPPHVLRPLRQNL
jgi:hypothetical protein